MGKQIHFTAECCKKYQFHQQMLQIKIVQNWILYKRLVGAHIYLPWSGTRGSKEFHVWNIIMYRCGKVTSLYSRMLPKYRLHQKMLQIKIVKNWILYKKLGVGAYVYLPWSGARGSKEFHVWSIIMYGNEKVGSLFCRTLQKISISLRHHWKFNYSFSKIFLK